MPLPKSNGQIRSELEKGRATRKGMDEGKGGQTQSLQERAGKNKEQAANLARVRNGREKKNGISLARAIPSKKVTGRERGKGGRWGGQKAHDGGLGDGVA